MRDMKDSGVEWIGEIPKDWTLVKLKNYYKFEKGINAAVYTKDYIGQNIGKFPVYSGQTENNGIMGYIKSFDYDVQECLFTTTVGAKVMTPKVLRGKFNLSQNCLIMKHYTDCCNKYMFYMLLPLFDYEKSLIPSYMQPSLRIDDLCRYAFYIPSISIQQNIADYLDTKCSKIDAIIAREKTVIEKLKEYKLSVITEAVTKGLNPNVPMKDSGYEFIGKVPSEWRVMKLRYIGNCQNGISKAGEFFGTGFPFVSYSDVYKNYELPKEVNGLVESSEAEQNNFSVQRGDIFFTRTSETIEETGLTSVCLSPIERATFAGFIIRVRPLIGKMIPEFSKYYFRSEHHRRFIVKEMNLVTRASLGQELLKRLPVLLPPIAEQISIAVFLEETCNGIDSAIDKKQSVITKLTEYKKSLIYEVVTGKKEV